MKEMSLSEDSKFSSTGKIAHTLNQELFTIDFERQGAVLESL